MSYPYPEHRKLEGIQELSQACHDFIEWLGESKGLHLAEYVEHGPYMLRAHGSERSIKGLLAEFFNIDLGKLEAEKLAMIEAVRNLQPRKQLLKDDPNGSKPEPNPSAGNFASVFLSDDALELLKTLKKLGPVITRNDDPTANELFDYGFVKVASGPPGGANGVGWKVSITQEGAQYCIWRALKDEAEPESPA